MISAHLHALETKCVRLIATNDHEGTVLVCEPCPAGYSIACSVRTNSLWGTRCSCVSSLRHSVHMQLTQHLAFGPLQVHLRWGRQPRTLESEAWLDHAMTKHPSP